LVVALDVAFAAALVAAPVVALVVALAGASAAALAVGRAAAGAAGVLALLVTGSRYREVCTSPCSCRRPVRLVEAVSREMKMLNVVVLQGRVTRAAEERPLPSGDSLVTLDLTVPGGIDTDGTARKAESVPLAWFDPPAWVRAVEVDAELVVVGRVKRRFYRAAGKGPLQSRTEVIVEAAAPRRRRARVAEIVGRALGRIEAEGAPPG
jgi:hypothetical protein